MPPAVPAVWLFPAVGTPAGAVVSGRIFRRDPDRGRTRLVRNLRSILAAREWPGASVSVHVAGRRSLAVADDEGFFQVVLAAGLPAGTHDVSAHHDRRLAGMGRLRIVPEVGLSIVSDLDDTIAVTHVRLRRKMLRTALFRDATGHPPVPGMARLFRGLAAPADRTVHYLSGTPVGLLRRTERFLARHGFPADEIVLRHLESEPWSALPFKGRRLAALCARLPGRSFVLFGDSGERDPEVYAELRERSPERVRAVLIRLVTLEPRTAGRFRGAFVFSRAHEAAEHLRTLGLLTALDVADVAEDAGRGRADE